MDPVMLWIFCFVLARFIQKYIQGAYAQTRAELRRARQEFANARAGWGRQLQGRMDAGWKAGPGASGWWWPAAAHRAWRGMRGTRRGATPAATALPHNNPWRRILAAGWANGRRAAVRARGEARVLGPGQAIRELATGIGAVAGVTAALLVGLVSAGRIAIPRPRIRRRPRFRSAVCDNCGVMYSAAVLQPVPKKVGDHTELWMLCPRCAAAARGEQPHAEPIDPPPNDRDERDDRDGEEARDPEPDGGGYADQLPDGTWASHPVQPAHAPGLPPGEPGVPVWTTGTGVAAMSAVQPGTRVWWNGGWHEITGVQLRPGAVTAVTLDGEPGGAWHEIGPLDTVHALPPGTPEPAAAVPVPRNGHQASPSLDGYAAGQVPVQETQCLSCHVAPCQCRTCQAPYLRYGAETPEPCGMMIPPGAVECPRGHHRQPLMLTVRSRSGRELAPLGGDQVTLPVWSTRDLQRRLGGVAEDPDLEPSLRPAALPAAQDQDQDQQTGGPENMTGQDLARSGDALTHGQWNQGTTALHEALKQLPPALEAQLASLTSAQAGRSQVTGVMGMHDDTAAWAETVRAMLTDVNSRELPVVDAVGAAGGPEEIAGIPYLDEV